MSDADVIEQTTTNVEITRPKMHKVIFHNDDFTDERFVFEVLVEIFNKTYEEAISLTRRIHNNGSGVAGVYFMEIAAEKAALTMKVARSYDYPLMVTHEEE